MKFKGTENYVATQDLMLAVNAAITLKRPLLVKGEPGTGKTMLAEEVAQSLNLPLLQWHIKSTTKAQQGLYEYDAVSRLRDSQLGEAKVKDIENYIIKGVLWQAFTSETPVAILIDEIDKADIEFPNDLLREIDRMEFYCYETRQLIKAKTRPLVFITSNNEKELPDAFLRRCFFLLEHLEDPGKFLADFATSLRQGALAFVTLALTAAQTDHIYEFKCVSEGILIAEAAGFELIECRVAQPKRLMPGARFVPRVQAMILRKK